MYQTTFLGQIFFFPLAVQHFEKSSFLWGNMTHHQHRAAMVVSLLMKMDLFLTSKAISILYRLLIRAVSFLFFCSCLVSTPLLSFLGVNVQEVEEDCLTEATTPVPFDPAAYEQTSTVQFDRTVSHDVTPSTETSPVEDSGPSEPDADTTLPEEEEDEEAEQVEGVEEKTDTNSDDREEPEGNTDSSNPTVDELLADWREDLEAFQQMEMDEL